MPIREKQPDTIPRLDKNCKQLQKYFVCDSSDDSTQFGFEYSNRNNTVNILQWPPGSQSEAKQSSKFLKCKTIRLHGNIKQEDRRSAFHAFQTEKSALLLSTDIAARGLDFPQVKCIIQYDPPGEATEYVHRVGRTARLGEKGHSLLFLQPIEIDYLHDLEKHGVVLTEYPLLKVLDSFPLYGLKYQTKKFDSFEMHPWILSLQKTLEMFISNEVTMKKLAGSAFCSWVRAYSAHRGELKRIFVVKKLHLGHVAKSYALKEQPSLFNKTMKRKRDLQQKGTFKKRKVLHKK